MAVLKKIADFFNYLLGYAVRFLAVIAVLLIYRPKTVYVNKKVQGKKIKRPTVIVSNHIYFIDGAVIGTVFRHNRIYTIAAKELYRKKILSWLLNRTRCIPIDRSVHSASWLEKAVNVLKKGYSLAIFPEGISSHNGVMRKFRPGYLKIALESGADILLVCQDGLYKPFGPRQWMLVDTPFSVQVPESGVTPEYLQALNEKIYARMQLLQQKLKSVRYGESDDESQAPSAK